MKHNFLRLSLLGILLLPSCANYDNSFYFELTSYDGTYTFFNENNINVEIYDNCYIEFNIPKSVKVNKDNSQDILNFKYDESKISLSFDHNSSTNKIYYYFQTKEIFNNESFIINFNEKTYNFKVNSLKPSKYNKLDEYTLGSSYKEFKEMLNSLTYYTYGYSYPGLNSWNSSSYWGNTFHYGFNDEGYTLDYLKYLKDDCYYPSRFDFAKPNLMYKEMEMRFDDLCSVEKDSKKHTMLGYNISISVIDPGCTNPTNSLRSMSFEATPLNYVSKYKYSNDYNNRRLNNHYYLLSKEYEDLFLNYKSNNLDIKLINYAENQIIGFFEDSTYLYTVSCYYER